MSVFTRALEKFLSRMPPRTAGRIDLLRPGLQDSWGGPLNGQERRRDIVRAIARRIDVDRVIETGTYRGTSTEFFAAVFDVPVASVEANRRFHAYSEQRLADDSRISVTLGDSRSFLRELAAEHSGETVFIYLDAHWAGDLPLREELEIIRSHWERAVVMIDDFAVPGDPGYTYDDYGPGQALIEDYLPDMPGWSLRYPSVPSSEETVARPRGCAVLLSPSLADVEFEELLPASPARRT